MKIEHFAYQVEDPAAVSGWFRDHLGFEIKRSDDAPVPVRFMADASGAVMIEVYNNPAVTAPDYAAMDPLLLHVAFACPDIPETVQRLQRAGATLVGGPETTPAGDEIAMLRDPWGLAIQLVKRREPMIAGT